jgi:hypothetical protein
MGEQMQRKLMHATLAVVVAAGLVVLAGWAQPASASPAPTASPQGPGVYLAVNGANPRFAEVAPRDAAISTDSSFFLDHMTWTQWSTTATGTGTATINLCDPDCATGHDVKIPVSVTLTDPKTACGREFFTVLQLTINGHIPAGLERSTTVPVAPFC